MRPLTLFALAALVFGPATGCDGQAPEPAADTGGDVSFLLDGQEWARGASITLVYTKDFGYSLLTSWPTPSNQALRQSLIVTLPKLEPGTYAFETYLVGQNGYNGFMTEMEAGSDYSLGLYKPSNSEGALVVTRVDPDTRAIEATFEGTFATAPRPGSPRTLPDTFRVTRGIVHTTLANPQDVP